MPVRSGEALLSRCGLAILFCLYLVVGCGPDDNPMGIGVSLDPSDVAGASGSTGNAGGGGGVGAPTVTSIAPEVGTTTGMNTVLVTGSNFAASTTVTFGTLSGIVTFVNATTLSVIVPTNATPVDVPVIAANGANQATNRPTYTYRNAPLPFALLVDAVGTFLAGGRIRTGNFNSDTNLDVTFIDNGNQVSIAVGNGAGLLTETPFGTVVPLNGTAITGINVGPVGLSDGIAVADGNQIRMLLKAVAGDIDTETATTITNSAEDVLFDFDATTPRLYVTKTPAPIILERYTIGALGALTLVGQVPGVTGTNFGEIVLGTREDISAVVITDTPNAQVRLVRISDINVQGFQTLLTGSTRSAATRGEDSILAAANGVNGTIHVITEDAGNTVVPLPLTAGGPISSLAVGDVNNDSLPDVVVTEQLASNGRILAFLNGGFQGARLRFSAATQVGSRSFASPKELVLGNFNGDQNLDIALFTDGAGTRLRVLVTP